MSLGRAVHQKPGEPGRNAGGRGEAAPEAVRDEARTVRHETASPGRDDLLAQALASANMGAAWKRVKSNRGSAGVDGLSIAETADELSAHWSRIRASLLDGSYRPAPVRRVQIPKPDGGVRELGIPTVTARRSSKPCCKSCSPELTRRSPNTVMASDRDAVRTTRCSKHSATCRVAPGWWSMWIWRNSSTGSITTS